MSDNQPTLDEYLSTQWDTLPPLIKQIIKEGSYHQVIQQALTNAGISHDDEEVVDTVSLEVMMVLVGLQDMDDFSEYLQNCELFRNEKGTQIASEVREKFLSSLVQENTSGVNITSSPLLVRIQKDDRSRARYEKFPQEVQSVVSSISEDMLNDIFTEFSISSEQQDKLMDAVVKVVVGFMTTGEFKKYTQDTLTISLRTTDNIFHKVDTTIFSPVREGLLVAFGEKDTKPIVGVTHDPYREPFE